MDIDSLNEIKRANDLASKKLEITNHVFEMLLKEVRDELFPIRQGTKVKKRSKRRQTLPKVKEIVNGKLVDKCFRRIKKAAQMLASSSIMRASSLSISDDNMSEFEMSRGLAINSQ